jgi:hypothetical protein
MFLFRNNTRSHIVRAIGRVPPVTRYIHTNNTDSKRPTHPITPHHRPFTSTMPPLTAWKRLIRYVSAKDGSIKYGEPIVSDDKPDIDALAQQGGLRVKVLEGQHPLDAKPTGEEDEVKQLLGPLEPKDVPIVRCVGLNYRTHSESMSHPSTSIYQQESHSPAKIKKEGERKIPH